MEKVKLVLYYIAMILIILFFRVLRLPIAEIFCISFAMLFIMLIISHLLKWRKARRLGYAEKRPEKACPFLIAACSFGLLFFGAGVFLLQHEWKLAEQCSSPAVGQVMDYEKRYHRSRYNYYTVVEFDAEGQRVRAVSRFGSNLKKYNVGEEVLIYFNPQNVKQYRIKGERNPAPAIFIILGVFFSAGLPILLLTPYDGKRMRQETSKSVKIMKKG